MLSMEAFGDFPIFPASSFSPVSSVSDTASLKFGCNNHTILHESKHCSANECLSCSFNYCKLTGNSIF